MSAIELKINGDERSPERKGKVNKEFTPPLHP